MERNVEKKKKRVQERFRGKEIWATFYCAMRGKICRENRGRDREERGREPQRKWDEASPEWNPYYYYLLSSLFAIIIISFYYYPLLFHYPLFWYYIQRYYVLRGEESSSRWCLRRDEWSPERKRSIEAPQRCAYGEGRERREEESERQRRVFYERVSKKESSAQS